jgi:tetratricopeptide (TPR) repeat protein
MVNNRSKEVIEEAKQVTAKAYLSLEKGFEISPQNQEGYWHLIQTIINEGKIALIEGDQDLANQKFEQAGKLAIEAVDLEPRSLVDQLRMLRVLDEILKDHDLASQKAKEALDIEPLWEDELKAYIINE